MAGRPRQFTAAQIALALDLLAAGKSCGQVQKMTGISKIHTIYCAKTNAFNAIYGIPDADFRFSATVFHADKYFPIYVKKERSQGKI